MSGDISKITYVPNPLVDLQMLTIQPGGEDLLLSHCVAPLPSALDSASGSGSESDSSSTLVDSGYASSSSNSARGKDQVPQLRDATRSFFGGMNNHSAAAREMMRCLRVAKLAPAPTPASGGDGYS